MLDVENISKLINVVNNNNVSHFEYENNGTKIIIDKELKEKVSTITANDTETKINKVNENNDLKKEAKQYIKALMAGTFYIEKDNKPLVKINDVVKEDTVIGLIEVMKLFNEVTAGKKCKILNILVKNGEFVEYGQPLFEIKEID